MLLEGVRVSLADDNGRGEVDALDCVLRTTRTVGSCAGRGCG